MNLRENWRVVLLVVFLLVSTVALVAPGMGSSDGNGAAVATNDSGPTNLKYGLELSGGTRIRAPINGLTAEDVTIPQGTSPGAAEKQIASNLSNADASDVSVRTPTETRQSIAVEVYSDNVTEQQFGAALDSAGYDYQEIRPGVTEETRTTIVQILRDKISEAGLSGGRVQEVTSQNQHFVVIEMPNTNQSEVENLVTDRGKVEIVATYPSQNSSGNNTTYKRHTLLQQSELAKVGTAQESDRLGPHVPIVLNDDSAQNFTNAMNKWGFTNEGIRQCHWRDNPENPGYCLITVVDGEEVYAAGMSPNLAGTLRQDKFTQNPSFVIQTMNMSEAGELQIHLNAGSLPASLDMEEGTSYYLAPSLAQEFKLTSFLTGLAAVLAVSGVVFLRYGKVEVALPMILTALSEVVILLGFASAIQLPLDLSHIAGFIAVIGTGVDDLIIIADEVMAEGKVSSSRVFQSRFRKAFWVIGAAAATTIIAMSPLAVLSLGDLQGFAIITILGVLIGVLITRPAYGDILRSLLTEK